MRISKDKNDPGFQAYQEHNHRGIHVHVNLVDVTDLFITADDEAGMALLQLKNEDGGLTYYEGEPATETVNGDVFITFDKKLPNAMVQTQEHIEAVRALIGLVNAELVQRAIHHDRSKFEPVEADALQKMAELVDRDGPVAFGTPEYEARKQILGPMLAHHYAKNSHHPEHFESEYGGAYVDGINGMTLVDVVEMFCDWVAAGRARNPDGKVDLGVAASRYNVPTMLENVFVNTLNWLDLPPKND